MSLYTKEYSSYDECDAAAEAFSRENSGHYYVDWCLDKGCYVITTISPFSSEPYWCNGELHYPEF